MIADKHSAVSEGDFQRQLQASIKNHCVQQNLSNQAQRKGELHLGYLYCTTVAFRNLIKLPLLIRQGTLKEGCKQCAGDP